MLKWDVWNIFGLTFFRRINKSDLMNHPHAKLQTLKNIV